GNVLAKVKTTAQLSDQSWTIGVASNGGLVLARNKKIIGTLNANPVEAVDKSALATAASDFYSLGVQLKNHETIERKNVSMTLTPSSATLAVTHLSGGATATVDVNLKNDEVAVSTSVPLKHLPHGENVTLTLTSTVQPLVKFKAPPDEPVDWKELAKRVLLALAALGLAGKVLKPGGGIWRPNPGGGIWRPNPGGALGGGATAATVTPGPLGVNGVGAATGEGEYV
ncbi:MAG: hypothetical protein ACRD6W_01225, partial [Nitrososphaerales archaeon]